MRSGAAQANPPFTSCETRHAVELKQERAPGTFLEGAAASVAKRVLEELLNEARMVHGRGVASTNETCQRNKAKASMQKKPGKATTAQREGHPKTKGRHAYLVQNKSSKSDLLSAHLGSLDFCPT